MCCFKVENNYVPRIQQKSRANFTLVYHAHEKQNTSEEHKMPKQP